MRETAWVSRRMSKELWAGYPQGVREAALEAPVWPGDQGGLPREGLLRLRGKWEVAEVRWWKDRGMFHDFVAGRQQMWGEEQSGKTSRHGGAQGLVSEVAKCQNRQSTPYGESAQLHTQLWHLPEVRPGSWH